MRLAAIDIGTNSLHMIVVRVRPDLSFEVIDREKEMVRLGAGGLDGRALTPEAMHAALYGVGLSDQMAVVVDIGGGSVEITRGAGPNMEVGRSFKLGVIRLTER